MGKSKKVVVGQFHNHGYEVLLQGDGNSRQVYSAGNAHGDSALVVPADQGVGLRVLRRFCIQTAQDIAGEWGAKYGGVERVPDSLSDAEFGQVND